MHPLPIIVVLPLQLLRPDHQPDASNIVLLANEALSNGSRRKGDKGKMPPGGWNVNLFHLSKLLKVLTHLILEIGNPLSF